MRSQDRIAYLAALSLLMSAAELLVPRILPFFRLGLANIPLLLALGMAPGHFALLLLLKAIGNAYISGTLFSVFAIISIAQTFASGIMMYALSRLFGRRISIYSVSAMGALASTLAQIAIATLYTGRGTLAFLPLMLTLSLPSSILVAFLSTRLELPEEIPEIRTDEEGRGNRLAIAAMILSAGAVMMTYGLLPLAISLIIALSFQSYTGRRIRLLPHLALLLFMTLSSLLTPSGRVLFSILSFPITEGSLIGGVEGALRLSSCMAISQGFSRLIVPKHGIIGNVMYIFSLMQSTFRETEGSLMERIAGTLELGGAVKTQKIAVNIPPFTLIGISLMFIALAMLGFLFY